MSQFRRHNVASGSRKLTPEQVFEMRERWQEGWTYGRLSRHYGIGVGQVGRICRGEAWQGFANPVVEGPNGPEDWREAAKRSEERFKAGLIAEGLAKPEDFVGEPTAERQQALMNKLLSGEGTAEARAEELLKQLRDNK
jgi:hypothetical protein